MQSNLILEQTQTLSGAQIQSLKVLSYTNQELDAFLQTEYLENPLLETSMDRQEEIMQSLEKFYEKGSEYSGEQMEENEDEEDRRAGMSGRKSRAWRRVWSWSSSLTGSLRMTRGS